MKVFVEAGFCIGTQSVGQVLSPNWCLYDISHPQVLDHQLLKGAPLLLSVLAPLSPDGVLGYFCIAVILMSPCHTHATKNSLGLSLCLFSISLPLWACYAGCFQPINLNALAISSTPIWFPTFLLWELEFANALGQCVAKCFLWRAR